MHVLKSPKSLVILDGDRIAVARWWPAAGGPGLELVVCEPDGTRATLRLDADMTAELRAFITPPADVAKG